MSRRGDRIEEISVLEELEACIQRRKRKYTSDLRTLVIYLTQGYGGVGGVLVYKTLQDRYPDEHRELREITRKALLVAEDPEGYHLVPEGYVLDRSDPDVLILNREDGTFVAVFSASGVTVQGILSAVNEDRERMAEKSWMRRGRTLRSCGGSSTRGHPPPGRG